MLHFSPDKAPQFRGTPREVQGTYQSAIRKCWKISKRTPLFTKFGECLFVALPLLSCSLQSSATNPLSAITAYSSVTLTMSFQWGAYSRQQL